MSKKSPGQSYQVTKWHRKLGVVINSGFRHLCHMPFRIRPIFELNQRARYRVRFSQTVGSPTDVNHRNPKCGIFVEAREVDDRAIFVAQVGHTEISLFGLPIRLIQVLSADKEF